MGDKNFRFYKSTDFSNGLHEDTMKMKTHLRVFVSIKKYVHILSYEHNFYVEAVNLKVFFKFTFSFLKS